MNILKKIIPYRLKRKIKENLGVPSLHWSLRNLKRMNFNPSTIVDIGAYEGYWTLDALEVFPAATVLMVEAQESKTDQLKKISRSYPNVAYAIALLSAAEGEEKLFLVDETGSQVVKVQDESTTSCIIRSQTLDALLNQQKIPYPDFLKLDVQGHELEVLKGAKKSLAHAEVCLLEVSLLDFGSNNPLLADMIAFMNERNFQAYDISQFMRRPFDKALFQIDVFFVKKDSPLIASKRWI